MIATREGSVGFSSAAFFPRALALAIAVAIAFYQTVVVVSVRK